MSLSLAGIGMRPNAGGVIMLVSVMGQMQECDHVPVMLCSSSLDMTAKHQGEDGLLTLIRRQVVGYPLPVRKRHR